jgi:hypothetical protein
LSTPSCDEGISWCVSGEQLLVGGDQMRELLRKRTFSVRIEQMVWGSEVGFQGRSSGWRLWVWGGERGVETAKS